MDNFNPHRTGGKSTPRKGQRTGRYPKGKDEGKRTGSTSRKPRGKTGKMTTKKQDVAREEIRLNKYIAASGICSRREADRLIASGLISVNGKVVTELGTKVGPGHDVRYNGERIRNEKKVS